MRICLQKPIYIYHISLNKSRGFYLYFSEKYGFYLRVTDIQGRPLFLQYMMPVMICIYESKSSWSREKFVLSYGEKVRQEKFPSEKTFVIKQNCSNAFLLIPLFKKICWRKFSPSFQDFVTCPIRSPIRYSFFVCFYLFQRSINDKFASQLNNIFETRYF